MNNHSLLLAAAAAALAGRFPRLCPPDDRDRHAHDASPRRARASRPTGATAIFTISDTDLAANKRNNTLHSLDLTKAGAKPVAGRRRSATSHDPVFGADGAIWFLAPVKGQRPVVPDEDRAGKRSRSPTLKGDISGFKISQDGRPPADLRRPRPALRRFRLRRRQAAEDRGGSARAYDQLFVRHWDAWADPGHALAPVRFPDRRRQGHRRGRAGVRRAGRRHAVQAVRRRRGNRLLQRRPDRLSSRCARRGGSRRPRPTSTFSRRRPTARPRRSTSPTPMTAPTLLPALSPDGHTLAYGCRWRAPAMNPTAR